MNLTLHQWQALGLDPNFYTPWCLLPLVVQRQAEAIRSPVRYEGWLVIHPDPDSRHRDVVVGVKMSPQAARDAADLLSGRMDWTLWPRLPAARGVA